jgi:putative membrane protein
MAKPKIVESADKLKDTAARMERETAHMERDTAQMEAAADRRTELAADRTMFAAERTYAAWVRTGLVALASGVGAKSLLGPSLPHWLAVATGSVLVLFSVFCFGAAVWRQLYPGPPPPVPDARKVHPVILLAINGFLGLVALAALISIWFAHTPA